MDQDFDTFFTIGGDLFKGLAGLHSILFISKLLPNIELK